MYAAAVEGLSPQQRREFDDALAPKPASLGRRALRAVPDLADRRVGPERLAAIASFGGEIVADEAGA